MEYSNENRQFPVNDPRPPHPKTNALQRRILKLVESHSLLQKQAPIIIAVSGGPDSICLLHLLSFLYPGTKRIAVYIDHGLRPDETPAEQSLVRKQAAICSASYSCVAVDVMSEKKRSGRSLEEAARILRYDALEKVRAACQAQCIAVGHTADDQAEEILLRLIRGSGSSGLSGMKLKNGNIIRPLLHEKKETLLAYLQSLRISYCIDSSNLHRNFLRNRIRLDLLVDLEQNYNSSIRQTLLQTAEILSAEDDLLEQLSDTAYQSCVLEKADSIQLLLPEFAQEALALRRRIFERICWKLDSRPSFKKIGHLLALCKSRGSRKEIHLSDGLRALREHGKITFFRPVEGDSYRGSAVIEKRFRALAVPGPGEFTVTELRRKLIISSMHRSFLTPDPGTQLIINADAVSFPLLLRPPHKGERFRPLGAPGKKKISRLLSDLKIPATERYSYPVLLSEGCIIAVPGIRIANDFKVTEETETVLLLQWLDS